MIKHQHQILIGILLCGVIVRYLVCLEFSIGQLSEDSSFNSVHAIEIYTKSRKNLTDFFRGIVNESH